MEVPFTHDATLLKRFCRLCLRECAFMYPLQSELREVSLVNMILYVMPSFAAGLDNLPSCICSRCLTKLDYTFHIQKEFCRNERRMRKYRESGALVEKLFEYQENTKAVRESYGDRFLQENEAILSESVQVLTQEDGVDVNVVDTKASLEKSQRLLTNGSWMAISCDCTATKLPEKRATTAVRRKIPKERKVRCRKDIKMAARPAVAIDKTKCYICDAEHESEQALQDHLPTHVEMLPYNCAECSKEQPTVITSLAKLLLHFRMHLYSYKCPHCPMRFSRFNSLYAHVRYKHEMCDNPEGYTCDECGISIKYRHTFMFHMRSHRHNRQETFKCTHCGRTFATSARLLRHVRLHTGERPFVCQYCNRRFVDQSQLKIHRTRHTNERGYKCDECGKAFFSRAMLKCHQVTHIPPGERKAHIQSHPEKYRNVVPKNPLCPYANCGFVAATYQAYYTHKSRHEMAHQCADCGRRFARNCELQRHRDVKHSTEHPFRCETCSKTFQSALSHKEHMDSHANIRNHGCGICGKRFVRRRNLASHMATHTNVRPHRCECGYTFKYKCDYNKHRREKHSFPVDGSLVMEEDKQLLTIATVIEGNVIEELEEHIGEEINISYGQIEAVEETIEEEAIVVEEPCGTVIGEFDGDQKHQYIIQYIQQD